MGGEAPPLPLPSPVGSLELCTNYGPKLRRRFEGHRELYSALSTETAATFEQLSQFLREYEAEHRYQEAAVVHGDPVFSNVLLNEDGHVVFLDMRGELGEQLTMRGDLTYDLSKVYQSLLGYDFIILGQ